MSDRDYELLLIEAAEIGDITTAMMLRLEEIAAEFGKGDNPRWAIRVHHRIERAVKAVRAGGSNALRAARRALDRQADGPVADPAPDPQPRLPFIDPPTAATTTAPAPVLTPRQPDSLTPEERQLLDQWLQQLGVIGIGAASAPTAPMPTPEQMAEFEAYLAARNQPPPPEEWPGWGMVERLAECGYNAERVAQVGAFLEDRWRVRFPLLTVPEDWTRGDVKRLGLSVDEIEPLAETMPNYRDDLMTLLAFPRVDLATGEVQDQNGN